MRSTLSKNSRIIIVGGGTWGCSTALHLTRRAYKNVTVFDPFPVPSAISAGNDINKVLEAGDDEAVVAEILLAAATQGWNKDPIFTPYFHNVGYILAASSPQAIQNVQDREIRHHAGNFFELSTPEGFRKSMPPGVLTGDFAGWKGWHQRSEVGWVHARKAMVAAAREAARLGATFVCGNARGQVKELIYANDGDVHGVKTADGLEHFADRVIIAAGAQAPSLVDFENQLRPTAWTVAHIRMSPDEARLYKNIPVIFHSEKGFFIEPDEDKLELKICDEHPGYCNWVLQDDALPRSIPVPRNQIPASSARRIREFLRETAPQLADRPFSHTATMWCADTPNRAFLITAHPRHPSLILAAGDSGHGFTHLPSIGGFVSDLLEGNLDSRIAKSWRWRPDTGQEFWGNDLLGRSGAGNKVLDLKETITEGWVQGCDDSDMAKSSKL
ncbi:FAD dependent oxidoreductase [Talaromyces proteolyticus]|uniref:FAD dependent oxidoreductase n=1 Tax=Talaromyces proteolyticus TaxID=1131652 RepID=A0AAD4KW05_9EURO|nr:FAD dependent oxidoreductase [Talaromyces proteolyticus]KAH8702252.1 FAD dependent oxidoreductase [Talaromyces proteolyticus]